MTDRWEVRRCTMFASRSWFGFESYEEARRWVEDSTGQQFLWQSASDKLFAYFTSTGEEVFPFWMIQRQEQTTLEEGQIRDASWDDKI